MMHVVGGFDLSLRSTGLIAIPADWSGDFARAQVATAGMSLNRDASVREQVYRLQSIRDAVIHFAKRTGITAAVIEEYAMGPHGHRLGFSLAELGGVVKTALIELRIDVETVSPQSARKLLGKQPRKDRKIWAAQRIIAMGAPRAWSLDILDAAVLANWKLGELGVGLLAPEAA